MRSVHARGGTGTPPGRRLRNLPKDLSGPPVRDKTDAVQECLEGSGPIRIPASVKIRRGIPQEPMRSRDGVY